MADLRRTDRIVGLLLMAATVAAGTVLAMGGTARLVGDDYRLTADFPTVAGLKPGAVVRLAGVPIGEVRSTSLRDDRGHVVLEINASVRLPTDSTAAIKETGLIGETYVALEPGHAATRLQPGDRIQHVVPPPELEDGVAALLLGKVS